MKGLLLDEMISPKVAEQLRALGVDVVAISESPTLRRTPDPDVLELAAGQARVLVTDNIKDFAPLNASWAAQGPDPPRHPVRELQDLPSRSLTRRTHRVRAPAASQR